MLKNKSILLVTRLLLSVLLFNIYSPVFAAGIDAMGLSGASTSLGMASDSSTSYSNIGAFSGSPIYSSYKLGPGDQIDVNLIIGDNAMSLDYSFSIGPDGSIFFPRIGEINLLGLSIEEAKRKTDSQIRKIYKEKYVLSFRLRMPRQVQLYLTGSENRPFFVGEKNFVSVYGEVSKAGRFEYLPNKKFSDYISYAGGPNPGANLSWSTITRKNEKIAINGYDVVFNGIREKDIDVMPGDVINVPKQFFYINDFASFTSVLYSILAFYNTFLKR